MSTFKPKHVAVFSLWAEDLPAAAHFYRDVIGLEMLPHHDHRPAFKTGNGAFLVIVKGQPTRAHNSEPPDFPLIAFAVEDLDGAIDHLASHGVQPLSAVESGPRSRWVVFQDPAGNVIEFVQFDH